jgi:glycosyltransferase involved in cell wall biosynthesis/SAM-dependent methyltransferase
MKKIAIIMGTFCSINRPLDFAVLKTSSRGLTGSDLILVELAKNFAQMGWDTSIFTCLLPGHPQTWEGCKLYDVHLKDSVIKSDWDAIVSINDPRDFNGLPEGPVRLFSQQLNGLSYLPEGWEDLFDIATSPSEAHLEHHSTMYKQMHKWHVVHDACNYEPNLDLTQKIPGRIIFTSSADRGAHWLLSIFSKIKERVPHASLKVFYNFDYGALEDHEILGPTVNEDILELAQRIRYIKYAMPRLKDLDVEHVGSVSKNQIIEEYKKAEVFAFPCDTVQWTEGFSISTLEALNYCATIISDTDALGSLYDGYAEIIKGKPGHNLQQWEDTIVKVLTDEKYRIDLIERGRKFCPSHDFSIMTKKLESLIMNHPKYSTNKKIIDAEFVEIKPTIDTPLVKLNIASGPNVFPSDGWINFDREDISGYLNYMAQVSNLEGMPEHQKTLAKYIKNGGQILFKVKDIKEPFTEFTDNSVDLVYFGQAIEHMNVVYEVPKLLKECYRMLKPGGVMRITTPDLDLLIQAYLAGDMARFTNEQPGFYKDMDPSGQLAMMMFGSVGPNCTYSNYEGHFFLFTQKSLTKALQQAGFKDIVFYSEVGKSKSEVMAREAVDAGCTGKGAHSLIVECSK